jgi:hypothetical protein
VRPSSERGFCCSLLSRWIAGYSTGGLATNFGQDAALFERFPKRDVFIMKYGRDDKPAWALGSGTAPGSVIV